MLSKWLKNQIRQFLLRQKWGRTNIIGHGVCLNKNIVLGTNCNLCANSIMNENVYLKNNVRVGSLAKLSNIEVGDNSFIESGVVCTGFGNGKIRIGKESYIGIRNVLDWSHNITIGDFVHIAGPSTGLWTHTSVKMCLSGIPLAQKSTKNRPTAPIVVEDNVYIGGNCTIYPGITIHHHAVVAPNSAVTKDVESFTMVGGVPAKTIKKLDKHA